MVKVPVRPDGQGKEFEEEAKQQRAERAKPPAEKPKPEPKK